MKITKKGKKREEERKIERKREREKEKRRKKEKKNIESKKERTIEINKAGYTATPVACGWAGAIFKVTPLLGQEL